MSLKIIHISDLHIGVRMKFLKGKAEIQREEILSTFRKSIDYAIDHKADVLLIAGDLFDTPYPSSKSINLINNQLGRLKEAGIFTAIIAGNHDLIQEGSVFASNVFENEYVHVLGPNELEKWVIKSHSLCIYGKSVNTKKNDVNVLKGIYIEDSCDYHVGLVHGSVELIPGKVEDGIKKEDIENSGLHYIAFGDWHGLLDVSQGKVKAWYCGALEVINSDQKNSGHLLDITLDTLKVDVKPVKLSSRVIEHIDLDITNIDEADQIKEVLVKLKDTNKILNVTLTGNKKPSVILNEEDILQDLDNQFFHVNLSDRSVIHLDNNSIKEYSKSMMSKIFADVMLDFKKSNDAKEIDDALSLGLHLLNDPKKLNDI